MTERLVSRGQVECVLAKEGKALWLCLTCCLRKGVGERASKGRPSIRWHHHVHDWPTSRLELRANAPVP
jgi:hypothetical protein